MKKFLGLFVAAFMVIAATSCSQFAEQDIRPSGDENLVAMTISVGGELTRTSIGEDGKTVNWCATDKIAIFDGSGKREFSIVEGSVNGNYAEFEGLVDANATSYYAVYPYEAAGEFDAQNGTVTATAAEAQVLSGKNVADGAILSVAHFDKGAESFQLKNAVGFFRVDITLEDITSIIIKGANVAGTAAFNAAGEVQSVSEGKNQVTLNPEGEVFAAGSYYVALLPGTTPAGEFSVMLTRKEGEALEMTANKAIAIARNDGFFLSDYKLVKKVVIKDVASLQAFLAKADTFAADEEIEMTEDIDLTDVELVGASSFAGKLLCHGHALMNWKSNGVALFESLSGKIMNLTIAPDCSLTAPDAIGPFGFIAKTLTATGSVVSCENYANITFNATKYGAGSDMTDDAVYFGALVGQSNGLITNSKNRGNITITSIPTGGDERGMTYIGGVVGLIDNSASESKTGLSRCENLGNISYSITGRGGYLFMGGVAGGTTAHASDEFAQVSIVDNCKNTGEIYHTFTQEIIGSGNAKSNYINMAGVIGYCEGSVTNCTNGEKGKTLGKVQLAAPTLKTGEGYSAANVKVAGVSCYAFDKAENCNNYGFIDVDGSFGPGYETYPGGGNKEDGGTFIAGVIAQVGDFDTANAAHIITNCHNYGEMDIDLPITSASGTNYKSYHHVGGVVAYSNAVANNLTNNAPINVYSEGTMNYLGGVVGQTDCNATTLTNNGDITYTLTRTGGNQLNNSNQLFGGVLGYNTGDKMTSLTNNNPVTVTINNTNQKFRIGGVAGSFGNAETVYNNATVTVNDTVAHAKEIDFGGVSGATSSGTISGIYNKGAVSYTGVASTGTLYLGGVIGNALSTSFDKIYNYKPVSISATTSIGTLYAGGLTGKSSSSSSAGFQNSTNDVDGDVTISTPAIATLYFGGITGQASTATFFTNAHNKGEISTNAGATTYMGGIIGQCGGKTNITDCDNSGALTFAAPELAATELNAAGICARPYAKSVHDNCTNSGAISVTAKSASKACYLGGIAAQTSNATSAGNGYDIEDCTVEGDININCPATWYVGGAAAYGSQWSSTTGNHRTLTGNTVTSDITISSTTTAHHVGGIVGHTGVHVDISGNSYTGAISVGAGDASKLSNVGGIVGTLAISQTGSTLQNATFALGSNTVDSDITCTTTSNAGLLVGAVINLGTKYTSELELEFDGDTVKNGCSINGTAITADNYKNYLLSSYDGSATYASLTITGKDSVVFE
ncbi:MAG: hypothetical protein J6B27_05805 [Alistipes sp.]|nr:hypothetical protein [Alistipes sp.]